MRRPLINTAAALALLSGSIAGCGTPTVKNDEPNTSIDFTYKLDKPCIHPGEAQQLTGTTDAGVNVGYAVLYPDGKQRGDTPQGTTGKDRKFGFSWIIPSDVPPGLVQVTLLAAAGQRSGSEALSFEVLPEGVPCP